MITWLLILLSVLWFSLSAWCAKQSYDLGTVVGKSIGSRLLWMSFAAVAALALWPIGKQPITMPNTGNVAHAAEFQEAFYVGLAVDDKQEYHAPGCPDIPQIFEYVSRQHAEAQGRHPHPTCIRQTGASGPAP